MPTLSKNPLFVIGGGKTAQIFFNFIPVGVWYLQHMGMARKCFKNFMQGLTEKYVFFERSVFVLCTGLACVTMTTTFQPIGILYEWPRAVRIIGWVIFALGVAINFWAIIDMGETGPLGFFIVNQMDGGIEYPVPFKPKAPTRFTLAARHPLYFSVFITLVGSTLANPISIGRI